MGHTRSPPGKDYMGRLLLGPERVEESFARGAKPEGDVESETNAHGRSDGRPPGDGGSGGFQHLAIIGP